MGVLLVIGVSMVSLLSHFGGYGIISLLDALDVVKVRLCQFRSPRRQRLYAGLARVACDCPDLIFGC